MVIPVSVRQLLPTIFAVLAAVACHSALATEVYTWTDKDGVVHFSDSKPADIEPQTIEVDEAPAPDVSAAEAAVAPPQSVESVARQRQEAIVRSREMQQEEQLAIEEMCARHLKRLEQMEPARRVYYTDENGQEVRMDDVQRVALIEESRNYVAENCN